MLRTVSVRLLNQGNLKTSVIGLAAEKQKINRAHLRQRSTARSTLLYDPNKLFYHTPTEGYIRTSPYEPVTIPDVTLDTYVWENVKRWGKKVAAVCVVTGRQYTYAQLRDHCRAFAVRLQQKLKMQPKDIIAVCLPNLPEYPIAVFGALEAGLSVTLVNPNYTADEIARQILNSGAKSIVGTVKNFQMLQNACNIVKKNMPIFCIRHESDDIVPQGAINFFEFTDPKGIDLSDLRTSNVTPKDLAILPYSSGTTGLPKGVMLSHENIAVNCEMVQHVSPFPPLISDTTETYQDVLPCLLPFFHIYGLTNCMISNLRLGCKLVTIPKFTADDLIRSLNYYKGSVLNLVPPIVLFLTNSEKISAKDAEHLRSVISGAAPIGTLDVEKFLAKFPKVNFLQGYGLTETSPVIFVTAIGTKNYSSAGFLVSQTEAKIVALDSNNQIGLGPNQSGELCVRGPQVMKGYLNNEEATRNTFLPNNWLRTGDVAHYDDEGFFYITDRMKELIKVKGFQVPPAELEEILRDHPKVLEAAVIGIPHAKSGEVPRAFIVLRDGVKATENEIKEYVAEKVIEYKRLEGGVSFINEIPKSASGKILRRNLKSQSA